MTNPARPTRSLLILNALIQKDISGSIGFLTGAARVFDASQDGSSRTSSNSLCAAPRTGVAPV
jgi:hypothetical protein